MTLDKDHWVECCPRLMLPYGKWTCDNYDVLFNRRYWPILVRKDNIVYPADPGWWVPYTVAQYFFDDGSSPWGGYSERRATGLAAANAELANWLLPTIPMAAIKSRPRHQALAYECMQYKGHTLVQDLRVEKRKAPWAFWFSKETLFRDEEQNRMAL